MLLTICLLLISAPLMANAKQSKQHASGHAPARTGAGDKPTLPVPSRAQTREAEHRLSDMGYWTGAVDGLFDPATRSALIAFQKWEGRPIAGQLTLDELEAIRASAPPKARELGYEHVEVDLDRQVLLTVNDDGRVRALPISSGSGKPFVDEGQNSIAYTPRGRFVVYDKEVGWQTGSLGSVYYANYISGGVAIHGSRNVPNEPASHGCIRIPMFAAREMSKLLPVGTIVLVYDKVSFVSAKSWVENPKLNQAGLLSSAGEDYADTGVTRTRPRSVAIKKARSRIIRAE
jgi:peptidoglycan hydrolase-like protein with peptidoglycan-binding domain